MDGHGGSLVSSFVASNFVNLLINMTSFKKKNYEQALIETFLKVNKLLKECQMEKIKKEDVECCFFNHKDISSFNDDSIDEFDDSTTSTKSNKSIDNLIQLIQNDKIINLIDKEGNNINNNSNNAFTQRSNSTPIVLKSEGVQLNIKNSFSSDNLTDLNVNNLIAKDMGTTCNVLLIKEKTMYLANIGDSRSFMFKKGKAIPLSSEHKTTLESEYQRIIKSGTKIVNNRVEGKLNLTRAIGDLGFKQNNKLKFFEQAVIAYPEITKVQITDDIEFVVMGCDGVWDCVEPQKFCEHISTELKTGKSIPDLISEIFDQIISSSNSVPIGTDNMSCIIVRFQDYKL